MLRGLWKLAWVEAKVFAREPMGLIGTLVLPAALFAFLGGSFQAGPAGAASLDQAPFNVAILAALFIAVSAVMSLVTIVSIYRESGILKRLRATPLSPATILAAHVVVQLAFTALSLGVLVLVGRRILPGAIDVGVVPFGLALLASTLSILGMGFVIASLVPTSRFARPLVAILLYPMIGVSGLFFPVDRMSDGLGTLAMLLPTTHAVTLMQGVWEGAGWSVPATIGLALAFAISVGISSRFFRWE